MFLRIGKKRLMEYLRDEVDILDTMEKDEKKRAEERACQSINAKQNPELFPMKPLFSCNHESYQIDSFQFQNKTSTGNQYFNITIYSLNSLSSAISLHLLINCRALKVYGF